MEKSGTMASSATDGSSNVSVPTKNRFPAIPCASAECAKANSAQASTALLIAPVRIGSLALRNIVYAALEPQEFGSSSNHSSFRLERIYNRKPPLAGGFHGTLPFRHCSHGLKRCG